MSIIWIAIVGLVIGAIAKLLMPGKDPGGYIVTALIGVAGALLASFLGQELGWYYRGQAAGFVASVLGEGVLNFVCERSWMFRQTVVLGIG